MPITIVPESPNTADAHQLIAELDAFSRALYPPESNHLLPPSGLAAGGAIFLVARKDDWALGCGALLPCEGYGEIKRMYVRPEARGRRLGDLILSELIHQAAGLGLPWLRLETGIHNHAALIVYRRAGFTECSAFEPYAPDSLSVFMQRPTSRS